MQHDHTEIMQALGPAENIGGNQPILLHDRNDAWFIMNGNVDVFVVSMRDGEPVGAREYFFSAGKGELIFGVGTSDDGMRTMMAVASPDTCVARISRNQVHEQLSSVNEHASVNVLVEKWISHLSHAVSRDTNPRTDVLLDVNGHTTLASNSKARARKGVVWVELLSGNALLLGLKELREQCGPCLVPITQDSWLQAMEDTETRSMTTAEACARHDFQQQLDRFYDALFFCELLNTRLMSVDEYNRLSGKARNASQLRSSSLARIASVINDSVRSVFADNGLDPLLIACRLVADEVGIEIRPPKRAQSDDAPALTLKDILRSSRFRSRAVRLEGEWYKQDNGPLLAFSVEKSTPLALLPRSRGRYECIDPTANTRRPVTAEVAAAIEIEAHQFYRPFPDQPIKGHHLIAFGLRSCVRDLVFVILAGICGGLLTLLVPVLTGTIFDSVIPRSEYHTLYLYTALIFVSSIAIALFQLVRSFGMLRMETRLDFTLQSAVWDRLLNLPVPFFRKYQAGELAASANSIMMLRKILSDTVIYSLLGAVFMSFNIILLFVYDAMLAVYMGVIMVFSLFCVLYIGRSIMKRQRSIIKLQNRIFGMLTQFLSSISKIRIAGAEVHAFSRWADLFSENKSHTYEVRRSFLSITLLTTSLPMLATLVLFAVIGGRLPDTMSTGEFMAFYTAMTMTVMSYMQLLMAAVSTAFAAPIFDSLRPILETLPENIAFKAELQRTFGEIEVSNVSFRYNEDGPLVLDNISLHIEPGEFVAIVGPSGSGKSTLLRLLLGFDAPGSGAVYYDRQDLASFDPASLRRQAGTVLQHAQLQPGTIFTNIVGMAAGTYEDAWAAARLVGLDEDISQMPMGMHTVVSGGLSTLSGGQRQRIMIARAIVSRPRILFFDEATSALDNTTQQIVSSSLEQLQATRVVIAHRLSTVRNADRIFVLDHGRIVEEGNYDTLMMMNGIFAGLVKRQMVDV